MEPLDYVAGQLTGLDLREDAMPALPAGRQDLLAAGCKANQGKFYPQFGLVVLLSPPAEILLAKIAERTSYPYGKYPLEHAMDRTSWR